MADERVEQMARTLVTHSVSVQPHERVAILYDYAARELAEAVMRQVFAVGGVPFAAVQNTEADEVMAREAGPDDLELLGKTYAGLVDQMDCYIRLEAPENLSALRALSAERRRAYQACYTCVLGASRAPKKWVTAIYPSAGMAQLAGMTTEAFRDYFFRVTNIDYEKLGRATEGIRRRMIAADKIHVLAPDTDLQVSLKGFTAITANGFHNLPDGEIASTPARDSLNGVIRFNVPSLWNGFVFDNIRLEFKNGKIVRATANDTERFLEEIGIDADSQYVGEFSFGTNPCIDRYITNIIFDEKMTGSLHMALGASYNFPGRDNGNRSHIHWDLVHSHLPKFGGGEIWMDGELIRKDGLYLPEDLTALNPQVFMAQK